MSAIRSGAPHCQRDFGFGLNRATTGQVIAPEKASEFKALQKASRLGQPLAHTSTRSFLEHVRAFDSAHPMAGKALGIGVIAAVSLAAGMVVDMLVDELAHLTERKNDNVGRLAGIAVGLIIAATHGASFFGLSTRFAMATGMHDFHRSPKTANGIARRMFEQEAMPLLMCSDRNQKSMCGYMPHQYQVNQEDMFHTVDRVCRLGIRRTQEAGATRDTWDKFMVEFDELPKELEMPYFRATKNHDVSEIKQDKYYVSKFATLYDLFSRDYNRSYAYSHERMGKFIAALKDSPVVDGELSKIQINDFLATQNSFNTTAEELKSFLASVGESQFMRKQLASYFTLNTESIATGENRDEAAILEGANPQLYVCLKDAMRKHFSAKLPRTPLRLDEVQRTALTMVGMRDGSLYTALSSFGEAHVEALHALNPTVQGRGTGTSIGGYIPLLAIGSTVMICGVGLSSSPTPPAIIATESGGQSGKTRADKKTESAQKSPNNLGGNPPQALIHFISQPPLPTPSLNAQAASSAQWNNGLYS